MNIETLGRWEGSAKQIVKMEAIEVGGNPKETTCLTSRPTAHIPLLGAQEDGVEVFEGTGR